MRLFQWWLADPNAADPEDMARQLFRAIYRAEPPA
jgi:hypothetical protein